MFFALFAIACKSSYEPVNNESKETKFGEIANYTGSLAEKAMVVTAHPEASRIGVEILQKGGTAVDAAVAVQFALTVCYPRAGNIGGGGFMVYRSTMGEINSLDFRERAPQAASHDMYLDSLGNVVPGKSTETHLAVGVPGTVDGMIRAHEKYGKLEWSNLVQPAIDLARNGFSISEIESDLINEYQAAFKSANTTAQYFQFEDSLRAGEKFKQEDLAKTFENIRDNGRAGFYEGEVAELFLNEMKRGGGIITQFDLDDYKAVWREPVTRDYQEDYRIISMGPPSSGGVIVLQLLEMMEEIETKKNGFMSLENIHQMTEAERLSYADRALHLGDPDFWDVPVEGLLSEEYIAKRRALIDPLKATRTDRVEAGNPPGATGKALSPLPKESKETTHFSIVDAEGNAVSITTTLNLNFGSKIFVDGAGFLLNNEMDDFSAKPGVANFFGLVGSQANAIAPGKRMLSSMSPTIVEKDGNLFMVLGTPGGSTIITSVFQCILNVVEHGMSMQEAVNAPRFHHQWKPDTLYYEFDAFSDDLKEQLRKMGHRLKARGSLIEKRTIGKVDAILVRDDGLLEGAADIRGEDTSLGF